METTSYRTPFDKVYRRTKQTLLKKKYKVREDELQPGVLLATRKSGLFRAASNLKIIIEKIDETSTSLTVYSDAGSHLIDKDGQKNRKIESLFIAMMTTRI